MLLVEVGLGSHLLRPHFSVIHGDPTEAPRVLVKTQVL